MCKQQILISAFFGKPVAHVGRRMGVVVCYDKLDSSIDGLRDKCKSLAAKVEVK